MRIQSFQIKNYKSILDSGICYLQRDLTVLAGKNESGKTGVLEALRDFGTKTQRLPNSAISVEREHSEKFPEITLTFLPIESDLEEIISGLNIREEDVEKLKSTSISIRKTFGEDLQGKYEVIGETKELLDTYWITVFKEERSLLRAAVSGSAKYEKLLSESIPKAQAPLNTIRDFVRKIEKEVECLEDEDAKASFNKISSCLYDFEQFLKKGRTSSKFLKAFMPYIPNFIFYSQIEYELPFEIPFEDLNESQAIIDFAKVSGLNLERLLSRSIGNQQRRNLLSGHSADISGDFSGFWGQDKIKLIAEPDGPLLRIGIQEEGKTTLFQVSQRSQGLRWFLSFYLKLKAEKAENSILLIDEPGLYLHPQAQKDVLKILSDIAIESQIIISTHSPYLIDNNHLEKVRLVLKNKDQNGSRIENKPHKVSDSDTLAPLHTAIMEGIGHTINLDFSSSFKKNVFLEGVSDYFYVQALRKVLKEHSINKLEIKTVPCQGVSSYLMHVPYCIAWGLDYTLVFDHEAQAQEIQRKLKKDFLIEEHKMIFISHINNFSIEDLFSFQDFYKILLKKEKLPSKAEELNSLALKNTNADKILIAKTFYDEIDLLGNNLSSETLDGFENLFDRIVNSFLSGENKSTVKLDFTRDSRSEKTKRVRR